MKTKTFDLVNMTAQEVFDASATHLLTQMQKSEEQGRCTDESDFICVYRNADGLKCAAGIFIPDNDYFENMEGSGWLDLVDSEYLPDNHFEVISQLQQCHDRFAVSNWHSKLRDIAFIFSLEFNYPNTYPRPLNHKETPCNA